MPRNVGIEDQPLGSGDVASIVSALLEGIRHGELEATLKEVEFLASVAEILDPRAGAAA
jgi:hypothetical protein